MAGQLSDAQPTWVRFPQLRSCFSGAMEAQLFRNQQAVGSGKLSNSQICPCRLKERLGGYEPSDARSSRAGDTVAVAERLCSGLWCRLMRVQIPSVTLMTLVQEYRFLSYS